MKRFTTSKPQCANFTFARPLSRGWRNTTPARREYVARRFRRCNLSEPAESPLTNSKGGTMQDLLRANFNQALGHRIRKARLLRGMTATGIARRVNISPPHHAVRARSNQPGRSRIRSDCRSPPAATGTFRRRMPVLWSKSFDRIGRQLVAPVVYMTTCPLVFARELARARFIVACALYNERGAVASSQYNHIPI